MLNLNPLTKKAIKEIKQKVAKKESISDKYGKSDDTVYDIEEFYRLKKEKENKEKDDKKQLLEKDNNKVVVKEDTKKVVKVEKKPVVKKILTPEEKKLKKEKAKSDDKIIKELINDFMDTFGANENCNKDMLGFTLSHFEVHDYGVHCRIYAPYGFVLTDLEKQTGLIETGCKCQFIYDIPQHNQFALADFVKPEQVKINEIPFVPIKLKAYEFCPGLDLVGKPIIFDVNIAPQILIAGQTRRGKNISCYQSVVSWIHYLKPSEITLYMLQGAKNDLSQFSDCEHVYCYTEKMFEMAIALKHVVDEMEGRKKLLAPMIKKAEGNDNIYFYNKLHPSAILPYIYIIVDEFIAIMPDTTIDSKETKNMKGEILNYLQQIVQYGASYGVNAIILHQKPEIKLMPGFLKNMCNVRICFGFEDETCVQIVLGSGLIKKAHKLPPRKAYFSNNILNGYLYTPDMKGRIKMYIKDSIKPDHRTLFGDLAKLNKPKVETDGNKGGTNSTNDKGKITFEDDKPKAKVNIIIEQPIIEKPIIKKEGITIERVIIPEKIVVAPIIEPIIEPIVEVVFEPIIEPVVEPIVETVIIPIVEPEFVLKKIPPKKASLEYKKVSPIGIVKEPVGIKNIPNYVPYVPCTDTTKIIDKTKIDMSNTEKPRKL